MNDTPDPAEPATSKPSAKSPHHNEGLRDVATSIQIGQPVWKILFRGFTCRCPICGSGKLFNHKLQLRESCPRCSLYFERGDGLSMGAIGFNTIFSFGSVLIVLFVGSIVSYPTIPLWPMIGACLVTAVVASIVFLPISRTFWAAMNVMMIPLRPGEVDDAFIVADPNAPQKKRWTM